MRAPPRAAPRLNPPNSYAASVQALSCFAKEFRSMDTAWGVPVLTRLVRTLCRAAAAADAAAVAAGRAAERQRDAGPQLMAVFPAAFGASLREKKLATLSVVNAAFKLYFKLNTLRLCKNMIQSVEARSALPLSDYPVAQQVTYRFYTGRLAVFDENYAKADADLSFAFGRCLGRARHNRALILRYLLPVKLLLGVLPAGSLFSEFPELGCYAPLVRAVRCGDVRALDVALEEQQEAFIRQGTYLLVEKLRSGVYRTLVKRIHAAQREREPAKAFQLPIALFQRALLWLGVEMELDECEVRARRARRRKIGGGAADRRDSVWPPRDGCSRRRVTRARLTRPSLLCQCVLANLIFRKYIKGYISHKQRVLVLSKANAFPPLATISSSEEPA